MKEWQQETNWLKREKGFNVKVKKWTMQGWDFENNELKTKNCWNIYVSYFRDNPDFNSIKNEDFDFGYDFHGGITYTNFTENVKEIGCDYLHCNDEKFEGFSTPKEAYEVFDDANAIYEYLKQRYK